MNYLFTGQESCLKEEALAKLKFKYLTTSFSIESNFHTYRAGVDDIHTIISSAQIMPFGAQFRIILIKEIENFSSGEKEILLKYFAHPSKHSIFVFDTTKETEKDTFFRNLKSYVKKIVFEKPQGYKLEAWIKNEFRHFNKNISFEGISLIKLLAGSKHLSALRKEIQKVCIFAGDRNEITKSDLQEIFSAYVDEDIFKLAEAVNAKHVDRALDIVSNLTLRRTSPQEIIGLLAWRLRNARLEAREKNVSKVQSLKKAAEKLLSADLASKESRIDKRLILEFAVLELCRQPN